jgi:hypothetical protein
MHENAGLADNPGELGALRWDEPLLFGNLHHEVRVERCRIAPRRSPVRVRLAPLKCSARKPHREVLGEHVVLITESAEARVKHDDPLLESRRLQLTVLEGFLVAVDRAFVRGLTGTSSTGGQIAARSHFRRPPDSAY